jgi:hypothetical protein
MKLHEATSLEFDARIKNTLSVFHRAAFADLNRNRAEELVRLLLIEGKWEAGLILGRQGTTWLSPFSAPFGGFSRLNQLEPSVEVVDRMVRALIEFLQQKAATSLQLTFPPLFYDQTFLTKVQSACQRQDFVVTDWDLNFAVDTTDASRLLPAFSRSALQNLNKANQSELTFEPVHGEDGLLKAYELIRLNREQKGYRLSMSAEQMLQTSSEVPVEAFIVAQAGKTLASAILYKHRSDLVQVIYWGDVSDKDTPKGIMPYLAYQLFSHYSGLGVRWVDVGPSMNGNQPIYGLCDFKESVGCSVYPKISMLWKHT